ncbi:M14 family metallopeptidase [Flavobacteriaceae bacterium]|nr:M14 family metallopeptidase [Flavobacteriaceae bacterium]MDC0955526.1 M14 family metallopeptidase [bacterium]
MKNIIYLYILSFTLISFGQENISLDYYFSQQDISTLNKDIPSPESVIGHPVGKWHISHDKLVEYMRKLASTSERITIEERGKTFEDRPLILLTITSKKNHQNINQIQKNHIDQTNGILTPKIDTPLVVYQGFSIHGNEPSGSNSALLLAYYLAASNDDFVNKLLSNTIILLDPSFNPDGLQRFAYWANTNKNINLNPDSNDREYNEVWPGARTNHYWFDMNRDWLPVQLPESRARINTFHKWLPNILTDHHEMGTNSTFFFQPGVPSRTHPLTSKLNQDITRKISKYHVEALDEIGSLYYSEERFDDFYYGKGSTFPDINGGIGILFEQASSRGHIQNSDNGILTFPFTIKNQLTAGLSTLDAALNMRNEILDYQYNFYKKSREEGGKQKKSAIIFGDEKDAAKTYHLAEILKRHKIKFHHIRNNFSKDKINYKKNYSFVVPKDQKNFKLINAMFEKRTTFQDSLFYDVSAWTFPLAFNLDYNMDISMDIAGKEVTELNKPLGIVKSKSNYAYLMSWNEYYSPSVLNEILDNNIIAKVALKEFKLNDKKYDYGTILIPVKNQNISSNSLFEMLNSLAVENNLIIDGVDTGLADGIDLGSTEFKTINKQKVAVLVGEGINSYDAGEIWHLFDVRYGITITKLDVKSISKADLSKYSSIIMPSSYGLSDINTAKIIKWTEQGGNLIAFKNSLNWISKNKLLDLKFKTRKIQTKNISFAQKENHFGAQVIGGAIFEAKLDLSHPINFGYKNKNISLFRNTTIFMDQDNISYNNPIIYTENPLLSGYISKENLEIIKSTVPFKTGAYKKGQVTCFSDNTNFRAFWYGTNKLLMNAIYFSEQF